MPTSVILNNNEVWDYKFTKLHDSIYRFYLVKHKEEDKFMGQILHLPSGWYAISSTTHKLNGTGGFKTRFAAASYILKLQKLY